MSIDDIEEPHHAITDIDQAEIVANLEQAAGRLYLALGVLSPAWANIAAGLPGYRTTTAGHTPPEDFANLLDDPNLKALDDLRRTARRLLTEVTALHTQITGWATPDPRPLGPLKPDLDVWCQSCLRLGTCTPIFRGVLCRWCYGFNTDYHQRPPEQLLRRHHDGERLTEDTIRQVLKTTGTNPKAKRKKRSA